MRLIATVMLMLFGLSVPALAQVNIETPLDSFETYFPVMRLTSPSAGVCPASNSSGNFCILPNGGVHISFFSAQLMDQTSALRGQLTQEINSVIKSVDNQLILQQRRMFSLTAASAAIQDAIPNSGDRFAIRFNAAGFSGYLGGAVGISANLSKTMRLSLNYGRSRKANVFNGGLNFSIH
jgi:hypothetical protein